MENFQLLTLAIFIIGYLFIALEHNTGIDKLIPSLFMMVFSWGVITLNAGSITSWFDSTTRSIINISEQGVSEQLHLINETINHHLSGIGGIVFFLIGAMTIVGTIAYFEGFLTAKSLIKTRNKTTLLWIVSFMAFGLSAVIDNLTAIIVLIAILKTLVPDWKLRIWYVAIAVIAANSGGAWSPIGDITTTMLWIAGKVEVFELITTLLIPSLVSMIVATFIASRWSVFRGTLPSFEDDKEETVTREGKIIFWFGLGAIALVPVIKTVLHLDPWMCISFSVALVLTMAEIISKRKYSSIESNKKYQSPLHQIFNKIEMNSVYFFIGILGAVAALESLGQLYLASDYLVDNLPMLGTELPGANTSDGMLMLLGIFSAVIDNVPLVAASIGMFSNPANDFLWHAIAFSAGTGGSMLIIGSAAGVAAMGLDKINFVWYLKKFSFLALISFVSGFGTFMLMRSLLV